jgi:shikimate kinase
MSELKKNIVLIGMPACGKSTIGVQLAKWLSMGFIDTDLLVQARAGGSMQAFQDANGMDAYQTLECDTVKSVICENCVIATGGSAVYCDGAMNHLKNIAKIIFLDVPVEEIKQRIGDTSQRGVVINPDMTLDDLYAERLPLYMKYAERVIDCAGKAQDELIREVRAAEENV